MSEVIGAFHDEHSTAGMAVTAQQQRPRDGHGEAEPRPALEPIGMRGGDIDDLDLRLRQPSPETLQADILDEGLVESGLFPGVTGRPIRGAADPMTCQTRRGVVIGWHGGFTQLDDAKLARANGFQVVGDLLELALLRGGRLASRSIRAPGRDNQQPVDESVAITIVGGQKHMIMPAGTRGCAIGLMARKKASRSPEVRVIQIAIQGHQRTTYRCQEWTPLGQGRAVVGQEGQGEEVAMNARDGMKKSQPVKAAIAEEEGTGDGLVKEDFHMP
jgi:hypothetical protein